MPHKAMYEILNNIKIIKLNAWEESFQRKIERIRHGAFELTRGRAIVPNAKAGRTHASCLLWCSV